MSRPLQVGIIGDGWARESHVPAVQALSGLELGAVATQTQGSADEAAKAFTARVGYGDPQALFADPEIDIVTVAVKVPDHHSLVLGALRAGKHVYCEWPLSPTLKEAEELAQAAKDVDVKVAIGLQTRANPAVARAGELIVQGAIGRVLGGRCYSTCMPWGGSISPATALYERPDAGMNLITIQAAHTPGPSDRALGRLGRRLRPGHAPVSRSRDPRRGSAHPPGDVRPLHSLRRLDGGGTFLAEIAGGRPENRTPFELVVVGETGDLSLTGGAVRGFQAGRLALALNGEAQAVDEGERAGLSDAALNVAGV